MANKRSISTKVVSHKSGWPLEPHLKKEKEFSKTSATNSAKQAPRTSLGKSEKNTYSTVQGRIARISSPGSVAQAAPFYHFMLGSDWVEGCASWYMLGRSF